MSANEVIKCEPFGVLLITMGRCVFFKADHTRCSLIEGVLKEESFKVISGPFQTNYNGLSMQQRAMTDWTQKHGEIAFLLNVKESIQAY